MKEYYENKIEIIYKKFIELFKEVLEKQGENCADKYGFIAPLANRVLYYYPQLKIQINRMVYIFTEDEDSEEKLDSLLNLYKIILEEINGKSSYRKSN